MSTIASAESRSTLRVASSQPTPEEARLRFGRFELDASTGELRRDGLTVKLCHQPFRLQTRLASEPGRLHTRSELQQFLWNDGTFVDFEQGLNYCIKEVRAALGDDAERPLYIETLPRRGYRFIAPVEPLSPGGSSDAAEATPVVRSRGSTRTRIAASVVATLAAGALLWGGRAPEALRGRRAMLAVLPFENLSGDREQDYLSDGLTEEMIAQLGRLQPEGLGVIARTSAMSYRGRTRSIAAIGRELGVDYVLEGSVRLEGARVRVTARLVAVEDQTPLWTDSYERELRHVLQLQGEIAEAIAGQIRVTLSAETRARLARRPGVDPEAYSHYLRGRYFWAKRDQPGLRKSIEHFQQAISRQPDYALAYVGLADAYLVLADYGALPLPLVRGQARAAAARALAIDDTLAEAHASFGMVLALFERDWAGAEREFRRAIELNPSYPTAHHWYSQVLRSLGRLEDALGEIRTALELDPLSLPVNHNLATVLMYLGDLDAAVDQHRRALELDPDYVPAHFGLGRVYLEKGLTEEAVAAFREAVRRSPASPRNLASLAHALAVHGAAREAEAILATLAAARQGRFVSPYDLALVHAGLRQEEAAVDRLEEAYRAGDPNLRLLLLDGRLAALRRYPRVRDLARRAGLQAPKAPASVLIVEKHGRPASR